ncbi:hypothetical protein GCM10023189_58800 [Nibrella saemangeumensis]|uniref:Uncharacterized protein n=1 Tax=Nibrella saemangeumensis TaxID=1084526 RepID=A0ABP8NPN8_9BACT
MRNGYLALVAEQTDEKSVNIPGFDLNEPSSYPVVVYPSGMKLLETLSKQPVVSLPEYIVLDLGKVEDEDLEAIRILKADERFRSIPVLTRRLTSSRRSIYHLDPPATKSLPFVPYQ